jgi:zinc/manganese transport system substrate-binding protein
MVKLVLWLAFTLLLTRSAEAQPVAPTISIVVAENFYGDVAQQLAGSNATVTSILSNPDEDPHLFEASPSVAHHANLCKSVDRSVGRARSW